MYDAIATFVLIHCAFVVIKFAFWLLEKLDIPNPFIELLTVIIRFLESILRPMGELFKNMWRSFAREGDGL